MRYREKLSIIIIRDNGPRRSFHMRRSNFFLLLIFFACLPFLCLLLTVQCWLLWNENMEFRASMERAEADYQAMESRAERLENLEALLKEENAPGRQILMRQLAGAPEPAEPEDAPQAAQESSEGPGHDEFPGIDTGRVRISNVQARIMRGNLLRIGLDLRNPDNEPLLSGEIEATLLAADGERKALAFTPREVATFRISRFKRTVMNAQLPRNANLVNAQIIIEVRDQDGKPIYRAIYPIQQ